jgi:hypothetical protein
MKRLFIALTILLLLTGVTQAASLTATFGDKNSSNEYRVQADTDGIVTYASDTAIKYPYKSYTTYSTAGKQLVSTDSGKVVIDFGQATTTGKRGFGNKFILPPSSVGLEYTIVAGAYEYLTVDTYSTADTILGLAAVPLDAGDSLKSPGMTGDSITVICPYAGYWIIESMFGTFTDNGSN